MNQKYFPETSLGLPEQNDNHYEFADKTTNRAFNEFTELNSAYAGDFKGYTAELYQTILAAEQQASRNIALIDFDTTYPTSVKLGTILKINQEEFIVTGISAQTVKNGEGQKLVFSLEVTGKNKDGKFYPAYLPSGHIKTSGPQRARVVDINDPCLENRVRVLFSWQDPSAVPSPWLTFSASGDGAATTGRHSKGVAVIVGFIDGNVERPYVMGAIQEDRSLIGYTDVDVVTPSGHHLRLTDGSGNGFEKFLGGVLSPTLKTVANMCPGLPPVNIAHQECLEGGFVLSDYYGVYNISGSTDDRKISINSPWGDVDISAFTGITINAPNGDVKIKGKNVSIEAGNNLNLVSGTNIKNHFLTSFVNSLVEVGAAAAKKLLEQAGKTIDFSTLRAVVEIGLKPVEGVLEIQSNRYLKLEAGGALTGYPDAAYKDQRAIAYSKMKANQWYEMGPDIAALIIQLREFVTKWDQLYLARYASAMKARKAFEQSIKNLRYYSNLNKREYANQQIKICNGYEELKGKLCQQDTKNISAADLAFDAEQVGNAKDAKVDFYSLFRTGKSVATILKTREEKKNDIVRKANDLLNAIKTLRSMQLTDKEILKEIDFFWRFRKKLPKNYMDAVKVAFSKEKCEKSTIYQSRVGRQNFNLNNDERQHLASAFSDDQKRALGRLVALNVLQEFGFKARKLRPDNNNHGVAAVANAVQNNVDNDVVELPSLFASEEELINNWSDKLNQIMIVCTVGSGLEMKKGLFKEMLEAKKDELTFKKVRERDIWSDAKSGQILFTSAKGTPLILDKAFDEVDAFYSKGKLHREDALDGDKKAAKTFNDAVMQALRDYSNFLPAQAANANQAENGERNVVINNNPEVNQRGGQAQENNGQRNQGYNDDESIIINDLIAFYEEEQEQ